MSKKAPLLATKGKKKGKEKQSKAEPALTAHVCNPGTQEAEAGGSPEVQDQSGLHSKLQARHSYTAKPAWPTLLSQHLPPLHQTLMASAPPRDHHRHVRMQAPDPAHPPCRMLPVSNLLIWLFFPPEKQLKRTRPPAGTL